MSNETDLKISFENDFPLHYLAKIGNQDQLKYYLNEQVEAAQNQIQRLDFYGRTSLHYASLTENLSDGEQCVKEILSIVQSIENSRQDQCDGNVLNKFHRKKFQKVRKQQWKGDVGEMTKNFINTRDVNGETALSIAAKNENPGIVQILLLKSADVSFISQSGEKTLALIYANTPSAVTALLNQSVSFNVGNHSYDLTNIERIYTFNLTTIVGEMIDITDVSNRTFKETELLQSVNNKKVQSQREILKHPLVQLFVSKKLEKFKYLILSSIIFHLIWLGLYLWIVLDVYYSCCENYGLQNITFADGRTSLLSCAHYPDKDGFMRKAVDSCIESKDTIVRPILLILISISVAIKAFFQLFVLKRLYFKLVNFVLWIFLFILFMTAFPKTSSFNWQYQMSSFGVVISGIIILEVVNKQIYWAIYIKVLIQVLLRFIAILPLFGFILVIFAISLRMLYPYKHPSLFDFRDAIMLVFEVIANGKVEWTIGMKYEENVSSHFHESGFLMFLIFYVLMTLLLFRILIGFVVADTKKIQEQEEINNISNDLEKVFMYETLLFSRTYRFLNSLRCGKLLTSLRENFHLCQLKEGRRDFQFHISEKEIPYSLRKPIRLLASKNISKMSVAQPLPKSFDA